MTAGDGKGPLVDPLDTSLARALDTASRCRSVDFKLGVIRVKRGPV